jgi:hypothetical protein
VLNKRVPTFVWQSIVNLAEHQGKEAAITNAYREYIAELADKNVS